MRKKLFNNILTISVVALVLFGAIAVVVASLWYTNLMIGQLKHDCEIIAAHLTDSESLPMFAVTSAKDSSTSDRSVRVTFIGKNGDVLGDSSADWRTMESHGSRPEFVEAQANGWGSSQHFSTTLKVNMLYVAVYDQERQLCIRTAMPLYEVRRIYWSFATIVAACLTITLALSALMANSTTKRLLKPIQALSKMTGDIASGKYDIEALQTQYPEFLALSNGLIQLAGDLNSSVSALKSSNTQLTTVLASIGEGLIAMDGESRLLFVNTAACSMLGLGSPENMIGQKVSSAIPEKAITDLSDECLREQRTLSSEIAEAAGMLLQVSASPMRPPASGCILLLVDITQLRKLENLRRDFVANVTHELRTPLTSIRGYVETLQSGALSNPELSAKFLQIIEIESERLSNLINDMMYLSEIESSNQDTGIRRFQLAGVANSVIDMLEYTAAARKIQLTSNIGVDIQLEANPDRIKQLLLNLADNALKYNQEGGSVLLSAERTHGLVRISVKDTGIGISEEHISRIFERFYRVDRGRSRSMGGTGLGLSIVKHIVDLYKGNIRLISQAGKGSEFIIELPVKYESKKKANTLSSASPPALSDP